MEDIAKIEKDILCIVNQIKLNMKLANKAFLKKFNTIQRVFLSIHLHKNNKELFKKIDEMLNMFNSSRYTDSQHDILILLAEYKKEYLFAWNDQLLAMIKEYTTNYTFKLQ